MKKSKAVFLDRDGTINREVDYLRDVNNLRLIPNAGKAIKELNKLGFKVVIITNQPVIARGWLAHSGVKEIHRELLKRLKRHKAQVHGVYYCPHHPNADLPKYRMMCRCRKPGIGMIKDAMDDLNIKKTGSYFVGDTTGDILAGRRAGLKTILVETGYAGEDNKHNTRPHHRAEDLYDAVQIIKKKLK